MLVSRLINVIHQPIFTANSLRPLLQTLHNIRSVITRDCFNSLFDPPYLESMKPKIPIYNPVNIQIKGYDFAILESYQKVVHQIANVMDIEVEDCWATPSQTIKVHKFKPLSSNVDAEYMLPIYERNTQVVDLPSTTASIFLEMIQTALPQGVTLSVHEHESSHDEIRYVPDYELKELKSQLTNFGPPKKIDKRKKLQ